MTANPPTDDQSQLPTDTADAIAPKIAANNEAADRDFKDALDSFREGIEGYGDRIAASAAVIRAIDDLAVPVTLIGHPRIEQAIWRYDHGPDRVKYQIEITIERESDEEMTVADVVAVYRVAAARLDTPIQIE